MKNCSCHKLERFAPRNPATALEDATNLVDFLGVAIPVMMETGNSYNGHITAGVYACLGHAVDLLRYSAEAQEAEA